VNSRIRVLGTGAALPGIQVPGARLDNATHAALSREAVARMATAGAPDAWQASDERFASQRIGVDERRLLDERLDVGDLARAAVRDGLERLGCRAGSALARRVGLLVVASVSGARVVPAAAARAVEELGGNQRVLAFDLVLGCNGFLAGLDLARGWLESADPGAVAVVVGSEAMSRVLHAADRSTSPVFGDGAGALFLERQRTGVAADRTDSWTLPKGGPRIRIEPFAPERGPVLRMGCADGEPVLREDRHSRSCVVMDGRRVFKDMVRRLPEAIGDALERRQLELADLDLVLFHQANLRLLQAVAGDLGLEAARCPTNISRLGNTTAASIPLLLHELSCQGRLRADMRLALVGFGTGYSLSITTQNWS
jgi:3-oxoacyl-[acyl-carrier-protein] synthase-3